MNTLISWRRVWETDQFLGFLLEKYGVTSLHELPRLDQNMYMQARRRAFAPTATTRQDRKAAKAIGRAAAAGVQL